MKAAAMPAAWVADAGPTSFPVACPWPAPTATNAAVNSGLLDRFGSYVPPLPRSAPPSSRSALRHNSAAGWLRRPIQEDLPCSLF